MKKILLFIVLFIATTPASKVLAVKEIFFEVTDPTRSWEIGRDKTYDYAPSVLKEDNGETKVYVCGGGTGGDAIYLTTFNSSGVKTMNSKMVLSPVFSNPQSDDRAHTCSPSVIKHSFPLIDGGKEKYLMYFECAPKVFRRSDGAEINTFTQTCVAFSDDGINWQKYNEDIWASQGRFANANEPPTAVMKISSLMAQTYGIEKVSGKWWTTAMQWEVGTYGVGHPSVLVKDEQIWLYYFNSMSENGDQGMLLAKSDDGLHFYPPVKPTSLWAVADVRYIAIPMLGHNGFFVSYFDKYYNYSWNGLTWQLDSNRTDSYLLGGQPSSGKCMAPGTSTFGSDKNGFIHSLDVDIYTNEGYKGNNVGDWCTATNGCTCYSPLEDQSRGYTWQVYMYKGKFVPIVTPSPLPGLPAQAGDLNSDGQVNIYDYNLLVSKFNNPYTIFDYNDLVANFGK